MLSYRHAYHAGNFADLLKHCTLIAIIRHLSQKDGPIHYLETHAGAGRYRLDDPMAQKTGEYTKGIGTLWQATPLPPLLTDYVALVTRLNPDQQLRHYPGSPWFAAHCLRPHDRLDLCELHSSDFPVLAQTFKGDRRVRCHNVDGYQRSLALVPPASKRGVIVIDPSYEVKTEYQQVVTQLKALHKRFATGVYALWYPVIDADRLRQLEHSLRQSGIKRMQLFEFGLHRDHSQPGMNGAGMVVINPPWTLKEQLTTSAQWLLDNPLRATPAYWRCEALAGE
jgi:23S rRNA (adenine2030-N6)-methyltransferase